MEQNYNLEQFLEKSNVLTEVNDVKADVLRDAKKYGVDLESLENFSEGDVSSSKKNDKRNEQWKALDVNLADIVNAVIETSERPFFIIRDDKLAYINHAAMQMLDIAVDKDVIGGSFFNLVDKDDWNLLAGSIGEMLTNNKTIGIRMKSINGKILPMKFSAIYLPDIENFSFILIGEHVKKAPKANFNSLYDDITGLPNFFLFEDRVQVAVAQQNAKQNAKDQSMVVVAAININNIEMFRKMRIEETVIKKIANNLVLNLPKNATVSQGLRYSFWVMLPDMKTKSEIAGEIRKMFDILSDGVSDNFTKHELSFSFGVSVYPNPAHSAKKLIEQSIAATKKAQASPKNSVEFFVAQEI